MPDSSDLYGTWELVSATSSDGSEPYGPQPMGRLVLAQSGRMMAVLCDGRALLPPDTIRDYASYCGNFRIEGDLLITRVDAALVAERIGGEQVRRFELRGPDLVLFPPRRADGSLRELVWRRIASV